MPAPLLNRITLDRNLVDILPRAPCRSSPWSRAAPPPMSLSIWGSELQEISDSLALACGPSSKSRKDHGSLGFACSLGAGLSSSELCAGESPLAVACGSSFKLEENSGPLESACGPSAGFRSSPDLLAVACDPSSELHSTEYGSAPCSGPRAARFDPLAFACGPGSNPCARSGPLGWFLSRSLEGFIISALPCFEAGKSSRWRLALKRISWNALV